jgi:dephospho-CoA kinase
MGIDASMDILLERIKARKRSTDLLDDAELKKRMDREWGIGEPEEGQQVGKCMQMADFIVINDKDLEHLRTEILKVLNIIGNK